MTAWPFALALGLAASFEDLRTRTVPNWLTAAGLAAGIAVAAPEGWRAFGLALAGAAAGFALFLPFHLAGAMGGGDVKLMAAFGALLGPAGILLAAVFGSAAGGVWALAWLLRGARAIPYAPAIAVGAWISLLGGSS